MPRLKIFKIGGPIWSLTGMTKADFLSTPSIVKFESVLTSDIFSSATDVYESVPVKKRKILSRNFIIGYRIHSAV
jgi:hypothetical protein